MNINNRNLRISAHALERAKQRLKINGIDSNSIVFEYKILELIKSKAQLYNIEENKLIYKMVYNNSTYKIIISKLRNEILLIETIIKE